MGLLRVFLLIFLSRSLASGLVLLSNDLTQHLAQLIDWLAIPLFSLLLLAVVIWHI